MTSKAIILYSIPGTIFGFTLDVYGVDIISHPFKFTFLLILFAMYPLYVNIFIERN